MAPPQAEYVRAGMQYFRSRVLKFLADLSDARVMPKSDRCSLPWSHEFDDRCPTHGGFGSPRVEGIEPSRGPRGSLSAALRETRI